MWRVESSMWHRNLLSPTVVYAEVASVAIAAGSIRLPAFNVVSSHPPDGIYLVRSGPAQSAGASS